MSWDSNPNACILIGNTEDNAIRTPVQLMAVAGHFAFIDSPEVESAVQRLKNYEQFGSRRTWIVLCTNALPGGIEQWIRELRRLRRTVARILVYATDAETSGEFAIDCMEAGACDFLVHGSYTPSQLEERVVSAFYRQKRFPVYKHLADLKGQRIFTITPFGSEAKKEYYAGVEPALNRLQVVHMLADEERHNKSLQQSIHDQIDESTIVIANITPYGNLVNGNVLYETGYAKAMKKKLILLFRKNSGDVPADLAEDLRLEYINSADLALNLRYGLRDR
jgi:hypothetical protein